MKRSRRSFLALAPGTAILGLAAGFAGKCKVEEESKALKPVPWPTDIPAISGEWKDPRPKAPAPVDRSGRSYGFQLLVANRLDDKFQRFVYGLWEKFPEEVYTYHAPTADGRFTKITVAWQPAKGYEQTWLAFIRETMTHVVEDVFGYTIHPVAAAELNDGVEFDQPLQLKDINDDSPILHGDGYGPIGVWDPYNTRRDWDDNPFAGDATLFDGIVPFRSL